MSSPVAKKAAPPSREVRAKDSQENLRMEKEMEAVEAQIAETFKAPEKSSLKLAESLKGDINENKGDFIEKQIREIDRELNNFDILGSNLRGAPANQKEVHVVIPCRETTPNLTSVADTGHEAGVGHMEYLNSQISGTKENLRPDTQVSSTGCACKGRSLMRTWTRVAKVAQSSDEFSKGEVVLSSKRTLMEVDNCEDPQKKESWLPKIIRIILQLWRLLGSPAKSNESPMLALSGAWEPTDRTRA